MRFDCNVYMRLKLIAFFIPNIVRSENEEDRSNEWWDLIPDLTNSIDEPSIRDKINKKLEDVISIETDNRYGIYHNVMEITKFEEDLFSVCLKVYNNLSPLFFPYHDENYCFSKEQGGYANIPLEDHPNEFYKTIPKDSISKKEIREKSFGMFCSLKTASYFFCCFTSSYLLHSHSEAIKRYEENIPFLVYLKQHLAFYFFRCPVEPFAQLNRFLSDLTETIELFSGSNKTIKDIQANQYCKEKLYEGIIFDSFDIIQLLSPDAGISYFQRLKACTSDNGKNELVNNKKTIWINNIKEAKQLSHAKRQEFVEGIKASIDYLKKSEHISVRRACEIILKENKIKLEEIGITSSRTLENKFCPNGDPNNKRQRFNSGFYIKPVYDESFQKDTYNIKSKLELAERISIVKQLANSTPKDNISH